VLVSLVLVFLHCPRTASLRAARAVAFGTIAMGIGESMTYGQMIGLTQNPEAIGNWAAWRWGMLGLGIKGAIWLGFAGLFLGMGLACGSTARRSAISPSPGSERDADLTTQRDADLTTERGADLTI
jgi:hypothetical protein